MGRRKVDNPSPQTLGKRRTRANWTDVEWQTERIRMRVRKYGITAEDYRQQYEVQDGLCATCDKSIPFDSGHASHIDHDHATNTVRGILCARCNIALTAVDEDVEAGRDPLQRVIRLVRYVESGGVFRRAQMRLDDVS